MANEKKEIIVDINENGEINAETFGFLGTDCELELDKLMKGLANSKTVTRKPEYFKNKVSTENKIKVGQK